MSTHPTSYNTVYKVLHWTIALLMIGALAVGLSLEDFEQSPLRFQVYGIHKSIGMIVLALVVLRVVWRLSSPVPAPIATQKPWEHKLAGLIHIVLYVAMIGMPVSGYIMSVAGGHPINIFGLVNVPALIGEDKALSGTARAVHGVLGNVLIGALVLHVAGALKHHFLDRDSTLKRMTHGI